MVESTQKQQQQQQHEESDNSSDMSDPGDFVPVFDMSDDEVDIVEQVNVSDRSSRITEPSQKR